MKDKDKQIAVGPEAKKLQKMMQQDDTAILYRKAKAMEGLSPEVQEALADFDIQELVGIAPQWKPEAEGDWLAGRIISEKHGVGKYKGSVLTIESNRGTLSIWMGRDCQIKMGSAPATGRNFVFQYEGWLRKEQMPSLANDMRVYKVIEVLGKRAAR